MNEEFLRKAINRIETASEQAVRAAEVIDSAVQRLAFMLEDGYGGNGAVLIELLEKYKTKTDGVSNE